MDLRMPVLDGEQTLQLIEREWPDQRPVCIAVSGTAHDQRHYLSRRFEEYIGKPFLLDRIVECMEQHLGLRYERIPLTSSRIESGAGTPDVLSATLPPGMRERLKKAADLNAFTEIATILGELRSLDSTMTDLADYLNEFLVRYDRAGLLAVLEQMDHE